MGENQARSAVKRRATAGATPFPGTYREWVRYRGGPKVAESWPHGSLGEDWDSIAALLESLTGDELLDTGSGSLASTLLRYCACHNIESISLSPVEWEAHTEGDAYLANLEVAAIPAQRRALLASQS